MHLIELQNISKIYSSDSGVAIGVQNVNLLLNLREFVLITGESGSGKSTLLNVIGGVDSFEEGELYFDGKPTSHYTIEDWDAYREKNVAFVFQNYHLVDNLSVKENVLLALTGKVEKKDSKRIAAELLRRVGLESIAKRRTAKLSGGQKQRVAIARALAMDCPIILADEPTANLDEKNAYEIIRLLKEIAREKLVIVVTHNFDAFEKYATREIRLFDGKVSSDRVLSQGSEFETEGNAGTPATPKEPAKPTARQQTKLGISLGWKCFRSSPKVSAFLCVLLCMVMMALFLFAGYYGMEITTDTADAGDVFRQVNGRVIVTRKAGGALTRDDVKALAEKFGAERYEICDLPNESGDRSQWFDYIKNPEAYEDSVSEYFELPYRIVRFRDVGEMDCGRYPENETECALYVPYALKEYYGMEKLKVHYIQQYGVEYQIVGVKYYVDNRLQGQVLLTNDGYDLCCLLAAVQNNVYADYKVFDTSGAVLADYSPDLRFSFAVPADSIYIRLDSLKDADVDHDATRFSIFAYKAVFDKSDSPRKVMLGDAGKQYHVLWNDSVTSTEVGGTVLVNPFYVRDELLSYNDLFYRQCSLYYKDEQTAWKIAKEITNDQFLAVCSTVYFQPFYDLSGGYLSDILPKVLIWLALLIALAFIVKLCTFRVLHSFGNDVAIMRTIGLNKRMIRAAVYTRLLIPWVFAVIVLTVASQIAYRTVLFSQNVIYLSPVLYCLFILCFLVIMCRISRKYVKKLYFTTVQTALKRCNEV